MSTYLVGIDVSTTATKALLIDDSGAVIAVAATEYPFETPQPLWTEQDAALFWGGTVQSVRAVLAKSGVNPSDIAGVGLSDQMHGLVTLNAAGQPLRPCILWNDQRTGAQCAEITARVGRERVLFVDASVDAAAPFAAAPVVATQHAHAASHALTPDALLRVYRQLHGCDAPPCTLLAIRGEHSPTFPAGSLARLARLLPQAHTLTIPDSDHMVPLQRPAETAAAIRDFAGRLTGARSN